MGEPVQVPFSATSEILRKMDELDGGSARSMSLRDYLAGQAITGWLASRESDMWLAKCGDDAEEAAASVASSAFTLADAMIAARRA